MTASGMKDDGPKRRQSPGRKIVVAAVLSVVVLLVAMTPVGPKLGRASTMASSHLLALEAAHTSWDEWPSAQRAVMATRLVNQLGLSDSGATDAFVLIRDGRLLFEWYRGSKLLEPAIGANTRLGAAAAAKGLIGSLLFGLALTDTVVRADDPVATYIPLWAKDSLKARITLRHLATHSSGLDDVSFIADTLQPGWKSEYYRHPEKRFEIAQCCVPILFAAGTKRRYSGIGYYVLAYVLAKAFAAHDVPDMRQQLRARIMEPLGIPSADWSISYDTSYTWNQLKLYAIGSGAQLTPRAAAKVGQLLLDRGRWKDRQLLSPKVAAMLTENPVTAESASGPNVSLFPAMGWWTNQQGGLTSAPRDAFAAVGAGHQVVLVIPSMNTVAVRFGRSLGGHDSEPNFTADLDSLLVKPLIESLKVSGL